MTRLLFIGDIFGRPGRKAVFDHLPRLIEQEKLDFVIANAENSAGGKGLTPAICQQLFDTGVDVITTGNHIRDKKEIDPFLECEPRLLRPLNHPPTTPGSGHVVAKARNGQNVAVVNASGRVHMGEILSPFACIRPIAQDMKQLSPIVVVDFHAEATSEKRAMGWYLDGWVSAMLGTHTHVQTADEQILPGGTAYITDVGMTGPYESVIGLRIDLALERFVEGRKGAFDVGKRDVRLCGVIVEIDETTGRANSIQRLQQVVPNVG